ncbi:MAG: hypothetical protein HHJ11_03335 [Phycicoccus sp.]|nr:hypothetical protein [Phycicoccus sp.]NMM35678.1 hypothetical protein [Phycicoccus sp.]
MGAQIGYYPVTTFLEDRMPLPRPSTAGFVLPTLAIAILSLALGGGAAFVAVESVVSSYGANDQVAIQTGPKDVLDPASVITYGG